MPLRLGTRERSWEKHPARSQPFFILCEKSLQLGRLTRCRCKPPIPVGETQSAYDRLARRNAFRRRSVRPQSRSFALGDARLRSVSLAHVQKRVSHSYFHLDRPNLTIYAADSMKLVPLLAVVLLVVSCASDSKKIYSLSTPELKLRHAQLAEEVAQPPKEKDRIEFELLRRWQAGDRAAYLPVFSL